MSWEGFIYKLIRNILFEAYRLVSSSSRTYPTAHTAEMFRNHFRICSRCRDNWFWDDSFLPYGRKISMVSCNMAPWWENFTLSTHSLYITNALERLLYIFDMTYLSIISKVSFSLFLSLVTHPQSQLLIILQKMQCYIRLPGKMFTAERR